MFAGWEPDNPADLVRGVRGAPGGAWHAGRPQRAHLLHLPTGRTSSALLVTIFFANCFLSIKDCSNNCNIETTQEHNTRNKEFAKTWDLKEMWPTNISGVLRGDDWLRQPGLSHRVVPLWLHGPEPQAEGEVVLPQVPAHVQEKGPVVVTSWPPLQIVIMLPKEEVGN